MKIASLSIESSMLNSTQSDSQNIDPSESIKQGKRYLLICQKAMKKSKAEVIIMQTFLLQLVMILFNLS